MRHAVAFCSSSNPRVSDAFRIIRDASRALAKMSFTEEDLSGTTEGLTAGEKQILDDWEMKFVTKYAQVGQIVPAKE